MKYDVLQITTSSTNFKKAKHISAYDRVLDKKIVECMLSTGAWDWSHYCANPTWTDLKLHIFHPKGLEATWCTYEKQPNLYLRLI